MNFFGLINLAFTFYAAGRAIREGRIDWLYWSASLVILGASLVLPNSVTLPELPNYIFDDDTPNRVAVFVLGFNVLVFLSYHTTRYKRVGWLNEASELFTVTRRINNAYLYQGPATSLRSAIGMCNTNLGHLRRNAIQILFLLVLCQLASMVGLVFVTGGSLSDLLEIRWTDIPEMYEGRSQYQYVLAVSAFLASSGAVALSFALRKGRICVLLIVMGFFISQMIGSRTFAIGGLWTVATLYIYKKHAYKLRQPLRSMLNNKTLRHFAIGTLVALTGYFSLTFIAWSRAHYSFGELLHSFPEAIADYHNEGKKNKTDASIGALFYTFEVFPNHLPYCSGLTYREMVLLPIPRFILQGFADPDIRTNSFSGIILARNLYGIEGGTARFGSIHPTIWGDAYANFGPWGCLIGIGAGLFLALLERLVSRNRLLTLLTLPLLAGTLLIYVRGSMLHATLYLWYPLLMLLVGMWVGGRVIRLRICQTERRTFYGFRKIISSTRR